MLHRPLYRFLGQFLKKYDRRKLASKILMSESFDYSIKNAGFVNSWSLMFACDIHPASPQSSAHTISYVNSIASKVAEFCNLNPGATPSIYIPSDQIINFANQILRQLNQPFVLVTGDSDLPINSKALNSSLETLLNSPLALIWFAQNRDFDHPKLYSLPIGVNIHNQWTNPLQWGGGFILPAFQELQLRTIAESAKPFVEREAKAFCNWHFSLDRADRRECADILDKSVCYFQKQPIPMADTWELQSRFQFVLSPHGAGLDCHRTWEALLLGCIPVIKKAKMNDLFEDLPFIEVEDWGQINQTFLDESKKQLSQKTFNQEKLLMRYWKKQIKYPLSLLNSTN
jgi:hypothetical protein